MWQIQYLYELAAKVNIYDWSKFQADTTIELKVIACYHKIQSFCKIQAFKMAEKLDMVFSLAYRDPSTVCKSFKTIWFGLS